MPSPADSENLFDEEQGETEDVIANEGVSEASDGETFLNYVATCTKCSNTYPFPEE